MGLIIAASGYNAVTPDIPVIPKFDGKGTHTGYLKQSNVKYFGQGMHLVFPSPSSSLTFGVSLDVYSNSGGWLWTDSMNGASFASLRDTSGNFVAGLLTYGDPGGNDDVQVALAYQDTVNGLTVGSKFSFAQMFSPTADIFANISFAVNRGSNGAMALYANGVEQYTLPFANGVSLSDIGELFFLEHPVWVGSESGGYKNIIVSTANLQGSEFHFQRPSAEGIDTDGQNFVLANADSDIPSDTAPAFTLAADGDRQSVMVPSRTLANQDALGLTFSVSAEKGRSSVLSGIKLYLTIAGTRYYSPTLLLDNTLSRYSYTWSNNPATGAEWLKSELEDATIEYGVEAVA